MSPPSPLVSDFFIAVEPLAVEIWSQGNRMRKLSMQPCLMEAFDFFGILFSPPYTVKKRKGV